MKVIMVAKYISMHLYLLNIVGMLLDIFSKLHYLCYSILLKNIQLSIQSRSLEGFHTIHSLPHCKLNIYFKINYISIPLDTKDMLFMQGIRNFLFKEGWVILLAIQCYYCRL